MSRLLKSLLLLVAVAALVVARPYIFPEKPLEVDIFRAARGAVRETVTSPSSGTIVSKHQSIVAAEVMGRVAAVRFDRGDRVRAGDVVVALDDREAQVEVRAAEAALGTRRTALDAAGSRAKKADDDHAMARPLFDQKLMPEEQFRSFRTLMETARADVEAARSAVVEAEVAVERARVLLAKRRIAAPFDGVIRRKLVEAGESVMLGTPCFEIYDDARIFVRAPIDEVDLPRIRAGLPVDVTLEPFGERVFTGRLRTIEPGVATAKEMNRTGEIEVDLVECPAVAAPPPSDGAAIVPMASGLREHADPSADGLLRVGMSANVEVVVQTHASALRIPSYAVHETDSERYVFALVEGKIERRVVHVGLQNWDYAEVISGISEGEAIVVSLDMKDLAPGKPARVLREVKKSEVE